MYDFMEYCLRRYYRASAWNDDNQYSNLCAASRAILDFPTPRGLSLTISRLPSPQFKSTYTLNALPSLNGTIGYLFTSRPLDVGTSATVQPKDVVERFRIVSPELVSDSVEEGDLSRKKKDYLIYGRMVVPGGRLETLLSQRLSPSMQYFITGISDPQPSGPSHITGQLQYDVGKWCTECSFTTDDGLLGVRGLYNFGNNVIEEANSDTPVAVPPPDAMDVEQYIKGRWSAGGEIYYGMKDNSGGVSTALRYRTLPSPHHPISPPLVVTYILNPIVGHMSAAYAAQVSEELALCSRFEFNMYSYDSDLVIGVEWRSRKEDEVEEESNEKDKDTGEKSNGAKLEGLVKARVGVSKGLALMWEGRYKNILFSIGLLGDLSSRSNPVQSVGVEIQYFA
ncbi:mitochondrial distribution and morphology protein 10 [Endogone sp. FLAS-F59071]|nr:mitochondrial distribution and morphology protein 10 [Endogone sp. FLAS-F59071]|eukprot:RUS15715.1 mitochondrial distribution and morphology protein 10 [Endogone sp. FLAS-F59071]